MSDAAPYTKLPGPLVLLRQSWQLYVSHLGLFLKLVVVPTLLSLIILALVAAIVLATNPQFLTNTQPLNLVILVPAVIIAAIVSGIISLLGRIAMVKAIEAQGNTAGVITLLKSGWPLLGRFILTQLLSSLVILLGFILLIIPGIILSLRYLFVTFVVITEGKSGWSALKQSSAYVKGKFWPIVGRGLFIGLPSLLISVFSSQLDSPLVTSLIQITMTLIISPIILIYFYQLYQACRLGVNDTPLSRPAPSAFS